MTSLHLKSENNWEKHEDLMKESKQYYISQYMLCAGMENKVELYKMCIRDRHCVVRKPIGKGDR